jgi:hypothetical protein
MSASLHAFVSKTLEFNQAEGRKLKGGRYLHPVPSPIGR